MSKKKTRRGRSLNDRFPKRRGQGSEKGTPLRKDGVVLAVVRPDDPEKAIEDAREIKRASQAGEISFEEAQARFNGMLKRGVYRFVGIATNEKHPSGNGMRLLDHDHTYLDDYTRPGDSFVSYSDVMRSMSPHGDPS